MGPLCIRFSDEVFLFFFVLVKLQCSFFVEIKQSKTKTIYLKVEARAPKRYLVDIGCKMLNSFAV